MRARLMRGVCLGVVAAAGAAGSARGSVVDLTTDSSGTINNALFQRWGVLGAGTGVIQSFLRIQNNQTEQGYNTSGRPVAFDEKTDPNFTRNIQLSAVPTRTVGGTSYYEFLLDTNEPNGGSANNVSLDQLKIFTDATGSRTGTDLNALGTLRYDLDAGADNWVIVNDTLSHGSGQTDARILIPTSNFAAAAPSDFVYLFARMGDHASSEGGFEEFAVQSSTIPLPSACLLAGAGLLGAGAVCRRR